MEKESWTELNALLDAVLDVPPNEREQLVEELGTEFGPLKTWLHALLERAGDVETNDFLGSMPDIGSAADLGTVPKEHAGETIGPYRLLRELGVGGMGKVWLAQRTDGLIKRPVALKLPRGAWRFTGLGERMAREREILATLTHPNIARLYDAGLTDEGQPYLALEYVEGVPIDTYCIEHELDIPARLKLFLQAADAIAYAHNRLVVHRDLKPENILVTQDGEARLLDFGIAKLLEHGEAKETKLTEFAGRALTPDYASPEQIAGQPITVASDVYSLGVLLCKILTETRPYQLKRDSQAALEEAILTADPARPSDLTQDSSQRRLLRGDLDTVILKALKKAPEERYATVNALVDDIQRYLSGRPVTARPDSKWYAMQKFMSRNKLGVSAAAMVLMTVFVGAGVSLWQARIAQEEKARAEEVKEFIASIFHDADPNVSGGKPPSAHDLLQQARKRLDRSGIGDPEVQAELRNILGTSLIALDDYDAAEAVLSPTLAVVENGLHEDHPHTLRARVLLAKVHRFQGFTERGLEELEDLLPTLRKYSSTLPEDLVIALMTRTSLVNDEGRSDDAISAAQEAVDTASAAFGERHKHTINALTALANSYAFAQQTALALSTAERTHRLVMEIYRDDPQHPVVIDSRTAYARALSYSGYFERAIEMQNLAVEDAAEVYGESSMVVGLIVQNRVENQLLLGRIKEGLAGSGRALSILREHLQPDSLSYIAAANARGKALLAARRGAEAVDTLAEAYRGAKRIFGPLHRHAVSTQARVAVALAYAGRLDDALREGGQAVEDLEKSGDESTYGPLWARGIVLQLTDRHREALQSHTRALSRIETDPEADLDRALVLTGLGLAQLELGDFGNASASFERARTLFQAEQQRITPAHADALIGLGRVHLALGDPEAAVTFLEQADGFWREFDAQSRWAGEAALWLGRCYVVQGRDGLAKEAFARASKTLSRSPIRSDKNLLALTQRG